MTTPGPADMEAFLIARAKMIDCVSHVLAQHRPERDRDQKVVHCTKVYDPYPHISIKAQWPGWRDHVAPEIVDAIFDLILAGVRRHRGDDSPNPTTKETP